MRLNKNWHFTCVLASSLSLPHKLQEVKRRMIQSQNVYMLYCSITKTTYQHTTKKKKLITFKIKHIHSYLNLKQNPHVTWDLHVVTRTIALSSTLQLRFTQQNLISTHLNAH